MRYALIAAVALFLAYSAIAAYVTGQAFNKVSAAVSQAAEAAK